MYLFIIDYIKNFTFAFQAHAVVGKKMEERDPMLKPLYKQRVKYVILQGGQKDRIKNLAVTI